jgi:predicted dehydrogenase
VSGKVGVAVVGVGFVGGQAHAPSFKKIEGSELIALCDISESRVKPLAEKYNVKYYLDYDKLLNDPKLDAVVLSVPTPYHYDLSIKAFEKGKHVLCEMPIAPTIEQVIDLQRAADKADKILMPDLNFRFAPIYLKVKEMLESGIIGSPIAVHYREFLPAKAISDQWPANSWAWNVEKSGGYPDFTLSVWSLDMLRWLLKSDIKDVEWMTNYPKLDEFGGILGYNTMAVIKFSNGVVGSLHLGASVNETASTTRLEVYGKNTEVIHAVWNNKILHFTSDPKPKEIDLPVSGAKVWGHRQIDEHFIDCVLNNREPLVTVQDSIKAQLIAQEILKTTN